MNAIIYDIEIVNAIPNRDGTREDGIVYCGGWHDHAGMGVSVIGVYDYTEDRYRVFCRDNFPIFEEACKGKMLVGFNSIPFDNAVISADLGVALPEDHCYDILRETWAAAGLGPKFDFKTHGGYGLDAMCKANFGTKKSGNGALAPVLWQRGQIGEVIDYCLNDVRLTKQLFDQVLSGRPLKNPNGGRDLNLRNPL